MFFDPYHLFDPCHFFDPYAANEGESVAHAEALGQQLSEGNFNAFSLIQLCARAAGTCGLFVQCTGHAVPGLALGLLSQVASGVP